MRFSSLSGFYPLEIYSLKAIKVFTYRRNNGSSARLENEAQTKNQTHLVQYLAGFVAIADRRSCSEGDEIGETVLVYPYVHPGR